MFTKAEGPLYKTQRIEFPHTGTYVEVRQARWSTHVGWEIEHGSLRFGHAGTWGRDSIAEAMRCFTSAVKYETR